MSRFLIPVSLTTSSLVLVIGAVLYIHTVAYTMCTVCLFSYHQGLRRLDMESTHAPNCVGICTYDMIRTVWAFDVSLTDRRILAGANTLSNCPDTRQTITFYLLLLKSAYALHRSAQFLISSSSLSAQEQRTAAQEKSPDSVCIIVRYLLSLPLW